ncbi:ribosome maturation factor RimM [Timonella sp. A28]|uniref:ribosome maturation factor RimM n=1 Tax=Timonella sp. A28 TaxID=3442640 RepID=UPI003EBFA4F2
MELTIARIGRAHGLRGEVGLELRTDNPDTRLAVGTTIETSPPENGPLTVTRTRVAQGRWYVYFAECADRTAAEKLKGTDLIVQVESSDEEDAWYVHELQGLDVLLEDGTKVGHVVGLEYLPAQDALVIKETNGQKTLIPFLKRFVPVVDVAGKKVVIAPPKGLLAADVENLVVSEETHDSSASETKRD